MAIRKFLAFCGKDVQLRVEQVAEHRWRDCIIPVALFHAGQQAGVPVVVPWLYADTEEACKRAVVDRVWREFHESPNSDGWWDVSDWTDQDWRASINDACGGPAYREYEVEEPKQSIANSACEEGSRTRDATK